MALHYASLRGIADGYAAMWTLVISTFHVVSLEHGKYLVPYIIVRVVHTEDAFITLFGVAFVASCLLFPIACLVLIRCEG